MGKWADKRRIPARAGGFSISLLINPANMDSDRNDSVEAGNVAAER
jgi:hypothetical protein